MAFVHGKVSEFYADNSSGTISDLSAYVDNVDWGRNIETAETTTYSASGDSKTYVTGLNDCTVSVSGKFDTTASTGPDAILSGLIGQDPLTIAHFPAGCTSAGNHTGSSTKPGYHAEAILTEYSISSPVGDVCTFSASWQVSGPVTRATSLVS